MDNCVGIDAGEDDEDGDCQCLQSYAPSTIGSPAPKFRTLDGDDNALETLAALDSAGDPQPICVYDPEWFDLPSDACPRILVFLALSATQATGWGITESCPSYITSPVLAPSSSGAPRKRNHRGEECTHLLCSPPRMQTSGGRVTASYTFDTRWACRRRLSRKVRDALGAARRLDRSRRITLRRMWACFPEADPLSFLPDRGELKIRTTITPSPPHQPEYPEDRQEPTRAAKVVTHHGGHNTDTDTNKTSPNHIHHAILANIDPLPGARWIFKTIFTSIRRSRLQRPEGQSLHQPSLEVLLNEAHSR